jgi:hypothetical protein
MVDFKKGADGVTRRFEADARQLVPVSDEIGGTVIHLNGRPAYYVLNGEWFQAVRGPTGSSPASRDLWADQAPTCELQTNEAISTS